MAEAPCAALARTDWIIRSMPNSKPSASKRFRHSVGVKNQTIILLEPDCEIVRDPIEHTPAIDAHDHSGWLD